MRIITKGANEDDKRELQAFDVLYNVMFSDFMARGRPKKLVEEKTEEKPVVNATEMKQDPDAPKEETEEA